MRTTQPGTRRRTSGVRQLNMKEIIVCTPTYTAFHRFVGPVYDVDYFRDYDGINVAFFPDPPDVLGWPNRKVPRRGISLFVPIIPTSPHGKPVMVSSEAACATIADRTLQNGWRIVFDRAMNFRLDTGGLAVVSHFLLYTSIPKTVDEFKGALDEFQWIPCDLAEGAEPYKYVLTNDYNSEQGQASSLAVVALRLLKHLWNRGTLGAIEQLIVADIHTDISMQKKPLQYLQLGRAQDLLDVLQHHDFNIFHQDQRENVVRHLEKVLRWKGLDPATSSTLAAEEIEAISDFESEDEDYSDDDEEESELFRHHSPLL